jgi:D-inositol-3-phosphate glycosyltransferase
LARLKSLASDLQIEKHVSFVGAQPHPKLPTFYRAADAVVVSSHSETFGFAALEAHACGTPVIGTAVGGLRHVVADGGSGFLVDSRDASVLAARAKTLLSDPDLSARFSRAAVASAERFSWGRAAEEFLELYECLVREDSPEACTC